MITECFEDICTKLSNKKGYPINYIWGESSYIRETLLILSKSGSTASNKFPLIGLYSPFTEAKDNASYHCRTNVNLIIAVNTLEKYTNEQRLEISFNGLLRPLYDDFIKEVHDYKKFDFGYKAHVNHDYIENYTFGRRGAFDSQGNELNDKIDAIEIKNLELTVKKENCYGKRIL